MVCLVLLTGCATPRSRTSLSTAAQKGDLSKAVMLVERGAPINRGAPLYHAIANRNFKIARTLIDYGADVNIRVQSGLTPLHAAVALQHLGTVEALLAAGADPGIEATVEGAVVSPLSLARLMDNKEIVELLGREWREVIEERQMLQGGPFVKIDKERLRRIGESMVKIHLPDIDMESFSPGYVICLSKPRLLGDDTTVILEWVGSDAVEVEKGNEPSNDRIKVRKLQVTLKPNGEYVDINETSTWMIRKKGFVN